VLGNSAPAPSPGGRVPRRQLAEPRFPVRRVDLQGMMHDVAEEQRAFFRDRRALRMTWPGVCPGAGSTRSVFLDGMRAVRAALPGGSITAARCRDRRGRATGRRPRGICGRGS